MFYREHIEDLQRFIARRVAQPHTAADLTADVSLAAIDAASGYRASRGTATARRFGIARNVMAAHRRQARETQLTMSLPGRAFAGVRDLDLPSGSLVNLTCPPVWTGAPTDHEGIPDWGASAQCHVA
ncbi:MAG: hypothetical protein GEU94_03195 [Micromonosporaceae bacterium]|nr:hypothetical protein [Micromonosporaceae bacterium]